MTNTAETMWLGEGKNFILQPYETLSPSVVSMAAFSLPQIASQNSTKQELPNASSLYSNSGQVVKTILSRRRQIKNGSLDLYAYLIRGRESHVRGILGVTGVASVVSWRDTDEVPGNVDASKPHAELSAWVGPDPKISEYSAVFAGLVQVVRHRGIPGTTDVKANSETPTIYSVTKIDSPKEPALEGLGFHFEETRLLDVGANTPQLRNVWILPKELQ